jgi:hypothetical protein
MLLAWADRTEAAVAEWSHQSHSEAETAALATIERCLQAFPD